MNQGWVEKPLGDVCEIYQPKTITGKDLIDDAPYPVFGANGIIGRYDKYNHEEPQLLITCRGATCGTINVSEPFSWVTGNAMVVRPKDGSIDLKFLEYALRGGFEMRKAISGAAQPQITRANLAPLVLRFPLAMAKQRRIVDLLSRAEGIVRLRREAEKKAAELIPALFLDMFGDPSTNPKRWVVQRLGDIAAVVSGVTKGRKFGNKQTVEVPYLRVANVQAGHVDLSLVKTIEVLPQDVQQFALQIGDVVLTEGGDFDKLGRGALWEHDVPNCIHQNHVFRVRLDKSFVLPEYFVAYLQAGKAREYFLRCAKRTTNLASINMTQLRDLPVVLPSLTMQQYFVEHFRDARSLQSQQSAATAKAQATFDALLAHVFRLTHG